jgi:hypothetical protein
MPPENITPSALPGDTHVIPSDANGTVGNVPQGSSASAAASVVEAMTLSELNQHLGKAFPTKEAALKSIADTFSYVGKKKEDIEKEFMSRAPQTDPAIVKELESIRKDMFYKDNPQYADPNVRSLIEKLGSNPSEVTSRPEFQTVFEKVKGYDESQKLKTVLDSNPRLATSRDALDKALDLRKAGAHSDTVEAQIAEAVLGTIL